MTTSRASRNNRNTGRKKTSKIWHVNFLGEVVPLTMRHFWCVRPVMAPLRRLPPLGRWSRRQCSRLCTVTSRFWHDQRSTSTGHTSSSSSSFSSSSSSSSSSSYSFFFFFIIIITLIIIFIIFIIIVIINVIIITIIIITIIIIIITLTSSTWASQVRKFQTWKPMAYRAKKKHVPIGCGRAPRALQEQSFDIGHFISCHLISYLHASSFLFWISSS